MQFFLLVSFPIHCTLNVVSSVHACLVFLTPLPGRTEALMADRITASQKSSVLTPGTYEDVTFWQNELCRFDYMKDLFFLFLNFTSWGGQWSWIIWVGPVHSGGFPGDSVGKESACSEGDAGDLGSIPGSGRSPWRRPWQPTSVFVPGESHGQRSLEGCSLWGCKESATEVTEHTHVHTALMRVLRSGRGRQRRRRGWDHVEAVHRCWLWRWRKWPQSGSKRELWMLEKQEKWIFPRASRKEHSPADTLIWAQQDPCQTIRTIRYVIDDR